MATYHFDSLADFGRAVQKLSHRRSGDKAWTGETMEESLNFAINGNTALVSEAEKLLSKMNTSIETTHRQWSNSVSGSFPSVPDYIMGHPESMRQLMDSQSEAAPMRVYVCTTSSGAIEWQKLQARGIAVLAATMSLCQSRPVELWVFTAMSGNGKFNETCVKVRINSAPLNLSEACYALCSIGYDRNLTHAVGWGMDTFDGQWPRQIKEVLGDEAKLTDACREMLGAAPGDLIVPPSSIYAQQIISDPVAWVQNVLNQYAGSMEAV